MTWPVGKHVDSFSLFIKMAQFHNVNEKQKIAILNHIISER